MATPTHSKLPQPVCRTANLTLASYLASTGKPYRLVRSGQGQSAAWEFRGEHANEANKEKKQFSDNEVRVEPRAFHHMVTSTRRILHDFIESGESDWDEDKVLASPHWDQVR